MLRKKLQQVQALQDRHGAGQALDAQQLAKLSLGPALEAALEAAEAGATCAEVQARLHAAEAQEATSLSKVSKGWSFGRAWQSCWSYPCRALGNNAIPILRAEH